MIELSFTKLLLLALVALIVLGPEKLPGAARTAGALLRRARQGWDSVRAEVERELEVEELRRAAREAAAQAEAAQAQVREAVHGVRAAAERTRDEAGAPFAEAAGMLSGARSASADADARAGAGEGRHAASPEAATIAPPHGDDPTGDLFADAPATPSASVAQPRREPPHGGA